MWGAVAGGGGGGGVLGWWWGVLCGFLLAEKEGITSLAVRRKVLVLDMGKGNYSGTKQLGCSWTCRRRVGGGLFFGIQRSLPGRGES